MPIPNDVTQMTDEQLRLAGLSDADLTAEQNAARLAWLKSLSIEDLMDVPIEPPPPPPPPPPPVEPTQPPSDGNPPPPPDGSGGLVDTDPYSNAEDGEDEGEEESGVGGN